MTGLLTAPDVSGVADLATAPAGVVLSKQLVSDLVRCPTLGAPTSETQANPLLDNIEGLAVTRQLRLGHGTGRLVGLALISDDNFSATQRTRVLNLVALLP